ncbi:MAG: polyribonucleotide nucleotidyltransferase [Patescibacteria group bacterium]|nr:polyribonucleotide nucleotidyltransferase [Patescibacteria group bacterium]
MAVKQFSTEIGGRPLTIEVGRFAGQADGACTVRYGDTVVLGTAVMSETIREGIDYFPLLVDYEERLYAAGKIKGSRFIKREGRPSDEAILTSRLVDRSIRPFFKDTIRNDVQVVITCLSVDQENDSDIPGLIAASCALAISNIPWNGPVSGVRVGRINDEWVLNPTYTAREKSVLDLVVVGSAEKVVMLEAGAKEVPEAQVMEAVSFGQKHLRKILDLIEQVRQEAGQPKMVIPEPTPEDIEALKLLEDKVKEYTKARLAKILDLTDSVSRNNETYKLLGELDAMLKEDNKVTKEMRLKAAGVFHKMMEETIRLQVLETGRRIDGRTTEEIRPLNVEVGILPRTHGSGLFQRGETQVLSIVTLGSPGDEQVLDTMEESGKKRYMHHYNFPGFSVGEVAPLRGPGRREIGHGALAEKALLPVLPDKEKFPYTIRVVSEVLSSNGSTSMASTCGSTLALMDAGVPISKPVSGISIGLMSDKKGDKFQLLTDIQGEEDHGGDMDFKVAGTRDGITAVQLDVKNTGLTLEICAKAFERAKTVRHTLLDKMAEIIPAPRAELSPYAPRITSLRIDPKKIRDVIGKGGETINEIIDNCGGKDVTKIDIEDDGLVMVTSHSSEMAQKAMDWIKNLTYEVQIGEEFEGTVSQIVLDRNSGSEIGAIVQFLPGQDGMVHISELTDHRVPSVSDVVKVGDKVKVKVVDVDKERGRISLSCRAVNETPEQTTERKNNARPMRPFGSRPRPMGPRRPHDSRRRY